MFRYEVLKMTNNLGLDDYHPKMILPAGHGRKKGFAIDCLNWTLGQMQ